jgi:hypothetical protein
MDNSQIEIQIVGNSLQNNHYWKKLISSSYSKATGYSYIQ